MFRKLVSNLPFSPALIHDVGFYAKRLRKEEATRRLTVLFVALALIMQSLAIFAPPESANASSEQDIIRGGVSSLDDFLVRYDHNSDDIKDILTTIGITRDELAASKQASISSQKNTYVLTRYGQYGSYSEEASLSYQRSAGGVDMRYFSPLSKVSSKKSITFDGWVGTSSTIGWFGIIKASGSVVTRGLPPTVGNTLSKVSSLDQSIRVTNLSQDSVSAVNTMAAPSDKIAYTLKATNAGNTSSPILFSINLSDTLEYGTLIDAGGGALDSQTKVLSWPQAQLKPGESQERTFAVQLLASLPAMPTGRSNPASYDCVMNAAYGDDIHIPVYCPAVKSIESTVGQLPTTGILANVLFAVVLIGIVSYFYARTRQLKKEIRIIRHNLNTGII